ncbi:MAG TPA: bifunctional DNA-formamidopyrimidine glycosylase/DNA-(apurinic or apyrimidinic site) lyase [Gemmatimonas aurantiaca]|uniref:Formamidopyrimidine-DNA glycosylase n=2 Tax=Gemmatimonas aurantiaca TaxID=173480 RepID=C1A643_GEMAT|nr:bifunctional DNA-formamidopyrimidine glycosylase/DNA-(apurinic or apyrimidinic site) lyase [Gemmatimonas aurantiaca]BAH37703.1 formamidopyrimidine-DNA glycosylase/AP lyase [Gemmatimonas aurantiaca T-27]HCT58739.1 bifunctional DNA-formamidopyrimidine glycosylase/DNA-(apurinic or apyrimidinic site) lyase [Gemmatimonas aurantiaca]
MPELPEVEYAASQLRDRVLGQTVQAVRVTHAAQARHLPSTDQQAIVGLTLDRVERRAKVQLLHFGSGVLEVHFRMTGDWVFSRVTDPVPPFERLALETDAGLRVSLVDPRALSVVRWHAAGSYRGLEVGPEPLSDAFSVDVFRHALTRRRGPIKPVLLDQRVVAGIGNIYASEALWEAGIAPTAIANTITKPRLTRLRDAIRVVLETAPDARYFERDTPDEQERDRRWRVYGRDGRPCRRCGSAIRRLVQAGRSTYYCAVCQRR